jgi:hypothetical protein
VEFRIDVLLDAERRAQLVSGSLLGAQEDRAVVGVEHRRDALEQLFEQLLQTRVWQGGVGDPLEVADPLRGGHRVGARIPLLCLQREPLGAHIRDVRDQDEADRGEQQRQTDDVAALGVRFAGDEWGERRGDDRDEQDERAPSRLDGR